MSAAGDWVWSAGTWTLRSGPLSAEAGDYDWCVRAGDAVLAVGRCKPRQDGAATLPTMKAEAEAALARVAAKRVTEGA